MKKRFSVLDIFRGLFASAVFLFHLNPFADTPLLQNDFTRNADMFVDFFFVLSGFVIANRYEQLSAPGELGIFFRKRFLRIYPLHLVVLIVFLAIELAKNLLASRVQVNNLDNPANSVASFFSNLLLLQSTPVFGIKDVSWNIASWSISAEMIAYLVFGVLMLLLHRLRVFAFRSVAYVTVVMLCFVSLRYITGGLELNYTFDYGFIRGLAGFFAGVLCLQLYKTTSARISRFNEHVFSLAEMTILVLTIYCICEGETLKSYGWIYVLLFFLCIYVFAFEKGLVARLLMRVPVLHDLGAYSYSIYMWHTLFISLFNVLFIRILHLPPSAYVWLVFPNFIAIFYMAKWSYKNIERRFQ